MSGYSLRLNGAVAALFCGLHCVSAHAEDLVTPNDRVKDFVSVYEGTSSSSSKIATLHKGDTLKVNQHVPFWYEVALPNGQKGYVNKSWSRLIHTGLIDAQSTDELRIHFVHTGPGTCIVVECPGIDAPPMLVDCGQHGAKETNTGMTAQEAKTYIRRILDAHPARPNVVLSHGDQDHYNYIPTVLEGVKVGHLWQGGRASTYESAGFPQWLDAVDATELHQDLPDGFHNEPANPLGPALSCGSASAFILNVNVDTSDKSKNNDSLVLMLEYGSFRAVFTGDAEGSTELAVRNNYEPDIQTTVVTGSHHGASTHGSNGKAWVDSIKAKVAVYTAGYAFGHPKCASAARFRNLLAVVPQHPAQCDSAETSATYLTDRAEFMTEAVGTVVITSTGRSPASISCANAPECTGAINH